MRNLNQPFFPIAVLAVWLSGAAPVEYEGLGETQIVGGNSVSARKRALDSAHRDAIARAVATMISPQQQEQYDEQINQRIYMRSSRYVGRYRVLEETQDDRFFRIRVAVALDVKRLLRDLRRAIGQATTGGQPAEASARPPLGLSVSIHGSAGEQLIKTHVIQALTAQLQALGIQTLLLSGPPTASGGQEANFTVGVTIGPAAGVRGLELPGARAQVELKLVRRIQATVMIHEKDQQWGLGSTLAEAQMMAVNRALTPIIARVATALGRLWPSPERVEDRLLLYVKGLAAYGDYQSMAKVLREKMIGIQRCWPWRLSQGQISWAVQSNLDSKRLAQAVTGFDFGDYKLRLERIEGSAVWLNAVYP